jgi:hypothetical protein
MTLPSDVAAKLGLTPDHLADVIATTIRSIWITGVALLSGELIAAVAAGAKTPTEILAYVKTNWLVWLIANIVAPAVRGARAVATPPAK